MVQIGSDHLPVWRNRLGRLSPDLLTDLSVYRGVYESVMERFLKSRPDQFEVREFNRILSDIREVEDRLSCRIDEGLVAEFRSNVEKLHFLVEGISGPGFRI